MLVGVAVGNAGGSPGLELGAPVTCLRCELL